MNSLRIPPIVIVFAVVVQFILTAVQSLLVLFGMAASTFADGGFWWERLPMVLFHPLAVIALFWLLLRQALTARPTPRLAGVTLSLLLLSIIGSLALSGAILGGLTKGDWWLPLVWVIIPLLSLPYVIISLGGWREATPRFAG